MTLDEAREIIAAEKPGLLVDESRPELDYLLALYRDGQAARVNFDVRALTPTDLRHHIADL